MKPKKKNHLTPRRITRISLFAGLMAVSAWIALPIFPAVPITLQVLALYSALLLLGGQDGTLSLLLYLSLGALGLPVFSGFRGGVGVLLGATGGYLLGFCFSALLFWLLTKRTAPRSSLLLPAALLSLPVSYAFGTLWYYLAYLGADSPISLLGVCATCVLPFLLPDLVKILLAYALATRLWRHGFRP